MLNKDMIKTGMENGCIKFVVDPNLKFGTVAQIGDYWFYFAGVGAEKATPEEYIRNTPIEEVIDELFNALTGLTINGMANEYGYCCYILSENYKKVTASQNIEAIPVSWIRKYARENGFEVKEVLSYMIREYQNDCKAKLVKKGA